MAATGQRYYNSEGGCAATSLIPNMKQVNCFDEIFKSQIELNNILKESQLRSKILVDIELNSPNITNNISFPRTTTIGCITLPCVNNTCRYHFNVCIGMQCVGPLPSYL
jgi:hypothetical protein